MEVSIYDIVVGDVVPLKIGDQVHNQDATYLLLCIGLTLGIAF